MLRLDSEVICVYMLASQMLCSEYFLDSYLLIPVVDCYLPTKISPLHKELILYSGYLVVFSF